MPVVSVMIDGGAATASAPLGPALGPLGINIGEVVAEINKKTAGFKGMKVPVKVFVDSATKKFEISVGFPPVSALIKKEAGLAKAAKDPKSEKAGELSIEQVIAIANKKMESLSSYTIKSAVNEVLGACNSMGIHVEGKRAVETIKEVKAGAFDSILSAPAATEPAAEPAAKPAEPVPEAEKPAEGPKPEPAGEKKPVEKAEKKGENA